MNNEETNPASTPPNNENNNQSLSAQPQPQPQDLPSAPIQPSPEPSHQYDNTLNQQPLSQTSYASPATNPTVAGVPLGTPETIVGQAPKSHKKLYIILGTIIGVLAVLGILFAVWFTSIRVQDSDYAYAIEKTNTMSSASETIPKLMNKFFTETNDEEGMKKLVKEVKGKIESYDNAKKDLVASRAYSGDAKVKAAVDEKAERYEAFRKDASDLLSSLEVYVGVAGACKGAMSSLSGSSMTVAQYDKIAEPCLDYFEKNQSVKEKDFNDKVYEPLAEIFTEIVRTYRTMIVAATEKDLKKVMSASEVISKTIQSYGDAFEDMRDYRFTDKNDPNESLKSLTELLEQQTKAFIR